MQNTCQVTNQSSHGELSFHHNPHLRLCWGLCLSTFRVIRRRGTRLKHAAHLKRCPFCCELCALKQKPGVLLENLSNLINIPTADRTHHRIRSPSIKCSGTQRKVHSGKSAKQMRKFARSIGSEGKSYRSRFQHVLRFQPIHKLQLVYDFGYKQVVARVGGFYVTTLIEVQATKLPCSV